MIPSRSSRAASRATRVVAVPADIVVLWAGVMAAVHVGKLPPAVPVLRDALGITLVEAGFLVSLVQFAGMALGLFIGVATDGIGLRRSAIAGLSILAVASALGGFARGAVDLLWLRGIEGFGFLLVALPGPSLIRELVPAERLRVKLGLWGCFMPAGTALALLFGPWAMAAIGWRGWWWLLAALSVLMASWLAAAVPSERERRASLRTSVPVRAGTGERWWQRMRSTLSSRGPWLVALTFATYSSQWLAVIGFLPAIYAQAGFSGQVGGALTALASAANAVGNIASGQLLQRGLRPRHALYAGFVAMALGTFVAFGAATADAPLLRYAGVLVFSAFGGLIPGALFSVAVNVAPSEGTVSTTIGWMQQWSAIGQFAGPPLVAWVASITGAWHWTWTVTGACCVAGLLLASRIGRGRGVAR
ncbi:MAG: MFS transporter [Burkholderiales bacterium]|nr:MFS transporter [Burkholderiales bacterium]